MIKKLRLALAALLLTASSGAFAQDFTDGGNYILKNVESGRFYGGSNAWGTQASLTTELSDYVTLHNVSGNVYKIEGCVTNNTNYYFNGSYVDNAEGSGVQVTFAKVAEGKYTLSNGTAYYGYDGSSYILASNLTADAAGAVWEVIPEADFIAALEAPLATATVEAPADATYLIKQAGFNGAGNYRKGNSWTWTAKNLTICGGGAPNPVAESFHSTFTLTQVINNVPNGVYAFTAQGFYRQDGSDNENLPVFYANDATATFPVRTGSEDDMTKAGTSFLNGNYTIEPIIFKVIDGTLTVGAELKNNTNLWCIWDNFRLTYYGNDKDAMILYLNTLKEEAALYIGDASVPTYCRTNLTNVSSDADDEMNNSEATVESLETIADNLSTAISAAKFAKGKETEITEAIQANYDLINSTNVYTSEAYESFKALIDGYNTKWEAGTLTENVLDPNAQKWGKDVVPYITFLMSAWSIDNVSAANNDKALYINTWSVEGNTDGSNFRTPFYEYWTGDGNSLGATELTATVATGKPNQNYAVTAWTRVRIKNGATGPTGITLKVGENGASVNASNGEQVGTSQFYLKQITAYGVSDENGNLTITYNIADGNNISWLSFKDVKYTETEKPAAQLAMEEALVIAEAIDQTTLNTAVKRKLNAAITQAGNANDETTWNEATTALTEATELANNFAPVYAKALDLINTCKENSEYSTPNDATFKTNFDAAITTAETEIDGVETVETANEVIATLEAARQTYVKNAYPIEGSTTFDMTFCIKNADISEGTANWTADGPLNKITGQHWSGDGANPYIEPCDWNAGSWKSSFNQVVVVPNGIYKLQAVARAAFGVTMNLFANNVEMPVPGNDTKGVIATDGTEWADVATGSTAGKTFANGGAGFGWNYYRLEDITVGNERMTIGATASANALHTYCSIDDFQLLLIRELTNEEKVAVAKSELKSANDAAKAITNVNVGDEAFQIPTSSWDALQGAISDADGVYNDATATMDDVKQAITDINGAVTTYKAATLNAPAEGEVFVVLMQGEDGWQFHNKPIVFKENVDDADTDPNKKDGVATQKDVEINPNRAQQIIFTQVRDNVYTMSTQDKGGELNYICTGIKANGNSKEQIRLTTDASKALEIEVIPTNIEGQFNLYNTEATEANALLGCQDGNDKSEGGLYTVGVRNNFVIQKTEKPSVPINILADIKYATRIFPFKPTLPEGVKAYSCANVVNGVLELEEVAEPEANVPYILENTNDADITATLTGFGSATADTYTAGCLTGTLAPANIPNGRYILQNLDEGCKFYLVNADDYNSTAYRVYLTLPASEAKTRTLNIGGDGETTGINAIFTGEAAIEAIYGVSGAPQQSLQKGLNIIKMSDGTTVKVFVK